VNKRYGVLPAVLVSAAFLGAIGLTVAIGYLPPLILTIYLGCNVVAFIAYAIDKAAAQRGLWRISEKTLHLFALAGGWPGAWIAQQSFRHKTKKSEFRTVFWVTVVANCIALAYLYTPAGQAWLDRML
jgi:uncharacterized membrane protein YsdA (DUF1294 family)